VSLFVWALPFDLSGMGDPTSSYATAGITLRVTESHKPPHYCKAETPSGGTHCTGGLIVPGPVRSSSENLAPYRDSISGPSSPQSIALPSSAIVAHINYT
jgi:hypothetical protein